MNFLGKSTGVGCHFLLQEIFPTQGLNQRLVSLHWQAGSLPAEPLGELLVSLGRVLYCLLGSSQ